MIYTSGGETDTDVDEVRIFHFPMRGVNYFKFGSNVGFPLTDYVTDVDAGGLFCGIGISG